MTNDTFIAGRAFILREARLLERRLFAALFEGAPAAGVVDALRGYQNDDGGFGHGLEPDTRCPASLPISVEAAFQALAAAGAPDGPMVRWACDYLGSVTDSQGAVPLAFPVIESYPRAEHMTEWTYAPGLNPTAGLAGLLYRMGAEHPWLARATAYCWSALDAGLPDDAHALAQVLVLLEHVGDQDRARALVPAIAEQLPKASWYREDPGDKRYGVTPLHLAPTPASPWRRLFADDLVEGHLDRLERDQQPDGGWPILWEPPSHASTLEWRGIETLRALRALTAYGR
ncbi:MAG: hypothetical protein ACRDZO_26600 [Egibacteraceae bacterium]